MALGIALAGIGALAKGVSGIFQGIKANNIDRKNIRPNQEVQQEYFQNVADAEQAAKMGMPVQQYQQALQNQQRNLTGGVRSLGRSANPSAGLASLLRASNDATLNLDVQNGMMKRQNQNNLFQQRNILAGQKQNAFDWNKKSPYLAKYAQAQALRGAGAQNLMGAFGDVQQIGMYMDEKESGTKDQQGNRLGSNGYVETYLPNQSLGIGAPPTTPRISRGLSGYNGGLRF